MLVQNNHHVAVELHDALADSIHSNFRLGSFPNIIHCMCHAPEIFMRFPLLYEEKPIMRASDDYYPDNEFSFGPHLIDCAFNSLLFSHFAIPDWDMFTTKSSSEVQAMARSVSGGPIYISDIPGTSNISILNKLVCKCGIVLCCKRALLPVRNFLLKNPSRGQKLLVCQNLNNCSGILAVFNVGSSSWSYENLNYISNDDMDEAKPDEAKIELRPDMVEGIDKLGEYTEFIVISAMTKTICVLKDKSDTVDAAVGKSDIFTCCPIYNIKEIKFAAIGFKDMYNPNACVTSIPVVNENKGMLAFKVKGSGSFIFAVSDDARTIKTFVNGLEVFFNDVSQDFSIADTAQNYQIIGFDIPVDSPGLKTIEVQFE